MPDELGTSRHDYSSLRTRVKEQFVDGEEQLVILRRQTRQRLPLAQFRWPVNELLRDFEVQQWIFDMFKRWSSNNGSELDNSSPVSKWEKDLWAEFARRVELAVEGAEEPDIYDPIMEESARYCRTTIRSGAEDAQKDTWIAYEYGEIDMLHEHFTVHLLERPRLLSAAASTGHRTWEAALALGTEILSSWLPSKLLEGKKVLELGAGTGLLSFLCASGLGTSCARLVIGTDGSEDVVQRLVDNDAANDTPHCSTIFEIYDWGEPFEGTALGKELEASGFDFVIAADVTYNPVSIPQLVKTLSELFDRNGKRFTCIVSATLRNKETFDLFLNSCENAGLRANVSCPKQEVQSCLFHPNNEMIRFIELFRGSP